MRLRHVLVTGLVLAGLPLAQDATSRPTAARPVTVATHYFYWYRWPGEHFHQAGAPGREGHAQHFASPEQVSYLSIDWHRQNLAAMAGCGIDVALPVYWGAPGAYDKPDLAFSRLGLPPMVAALDALAAEGRKTVKLGLFYDTSTLNLGVRGQSPAAMGTDLTTAEGRELFCTTVTDYFAAIPERHWARHRGGVLVVLYTSGFAQRWDRTLGEALRGAFTARFEGQSLCLVADVSWGDIGQDLTTGWGAALWGPRLHPGVAQLGPGYDDRPVPGRQTPIREREDGAFYAWSWQQVLRHRPHLVLLETWNEMHEGTGLCHALEHGDRYVDLTREWVGRLRAGADPGTAIVLQHPEPRVQPDLTWGEEAGGADLLELDFTASPPRRLGLRERAWEDGPSTVAEGALRPGPDAAGRATYLYFQVSDHWVLDTTADYELTLAFAGRVEGRQRVDYDAFAAAAGRGAYQPRDGEIVRADPAGSEQRFRLRRARFGNRQNGGADFRLAVPAGAGLAVTRITLRRLPSGTSP